VTVSTYTLDQLHALEMAQLKKERGREPDPDMWRWSPLEIYEFDVMLTIAVQCARREVYAGEPFRVLSLFEAGSGIGTKLWLAKNKFYLKELGWEINEEYLIQSAEMGVNAEQHDLRAEPAPVEDKDIVYIARPFKDNGYQKAWEEDIQARMKKLAVLISAFAAVKPYRWPCYYRRTFRGVWVKPERELSPDALAMIRAHSGNDRITTVNRLRNVSVLRIGGGDAPCKRKGRYVQDTMARCRSARTRARRWSRDSRVRRPDT
jgi:hypothetical protein